MLPTSLLLFSLLFCVSKSTSEVDLGIVGGFTAEETQFPYQVFLFFHGNRENYCGGSVIAPTFILTAAHCVVGYSLATIILGSTTIKDTTPNQVVINSTDFIIPEQYDANTHQWDLALIKLPEALEFNDYIQPIPLAEGDDTFAGDMATVAGWGWQSDHQAEPETQLRYVENVVMSNRQCISTDTIYRVYVTDAHICHSAMARGGACHGDSGGALADDGVQIGIVSFGGNSCMYGRPVVYTRITSFRDWIRENSGV